MKFIFGSTASALFMILTFAGTNAHAQKQCELNYGIGYPADAMYYFDSPEGKVRKALDGEGAFVIESTRVDLRKRRWAELSHLTKDGRKRLGWVQERYLEKCIPFKKTSAEEKWTPFYARIKLAVESRNRDTLQSVLTTKIYCQMWDICEFTGSQVQGTQELVFRKLDEKGGQRWSVLTETLNKGKLRSGHLINDQGEEAGYFSISLHHRTDSGRGYGFQVGFEFEEGKWTVVSFSYTQISGPG